MTLNQNKIRLAPRLRWGVGRDHRKVNYFKIGGGIFLALSAILVFRAGALLISDPVKTESPQVLGALDDSNESQNFKEYKVKKGDTLFTISKENNVEWTALATLNSLEPPFALQINQTIKIPKR